MAILTIGNVGKLATSMGATNAPVAQWSATPLPQVTFSGQVSPNMAGSALPPDRQLGTTLMQQQQDLTNQQAQLETQHTLGVISDTTYNTQTSAIQAALNKVNSDWNTYSQQLQQYMSQPTRTQMMQAQVITGFNAAQPTYSNPQELWQHSSMRVYQNGQWQTLPEAYTQAYGGDPYADIATMKFQQLSLANQLVSNAEKVQHVQNVAAMGAGNATPQQQPAQFSYAQPATNLGPISHVTFDTLTQVPATAPTGIWDMLKPFLTPKNIALALVAIALLILLSKAFGGSSKSTKNGKNNRYDYGDED